MIMVAFTTILIHMLIYQINMKWKVYENHFDMIGKAKKSVSKSILDLESRILYFYVDPGICHLSVMLFSFMSLKFS
jgi:hypothetical protein